MHVLSKYGKFQSIFFRSYLCPRGSLTKVLPRSIIVDFFQVFQSSEIDKIEDDLTVPTSYIMQLMDLAPGRPDKLSKHLMRE